MSNNHLRNKNLSLKAKGLLSLMLSLPDEWDYTEMGLTTLSKDGRDSVRPTIKELELFGYLIRTRNRDEKGRLTDTVYDVFESPQNEIPPQTEKPMLENPMLDNPMLEKPMLENPPQINTNKSNTNKSSTNVSNKEKKHKYGEFKNVLLTDAEIEKLKAKLPDWEKWIETLSQGIELKGYKYKSHYLAILKWAKSDEKQPINREYKEFWE